MYPRLMRFRAMADAIPVCRVAVTGGISTFNMAVFAEIGRELIEKAALTFCQARRGQLKSHGVAVLLCSGADQTAGAEILHGSLYVRWFQMQKAVQLGSGDGLGEIFAMQSVYHLQNFGLPA